MRSAAHGGVTLVEVMVALAVLAINLVGWSAAVRLIVMLLQRTAELVSLLGGPDLAALCSLALLVPRRAGARRLRPGPPACAPPAARVPRDHRGFTLVEVLVALTLSALVFGLVAAGFLSTARFSRTALASGDTLTVRLALPTMLRQAIEVAGRGVSEDCALAAQTSGRHLSVTFTALGGTLATDELFAALDGGGRAALYLRRVPHARQPWIEDVTSFSVIDVEVGDDGRTAAVDVAIEHRALGEPLAVRVALPHRPCLEVAP